MSVYHDEGLYRVRIDGACLTRSKPSKANPEGTDQVELPLDLLARYDDEDPTALVECRKSRFPPRVFISITDATMGTPDRPGWAAQTLAHLGFDGDFDKLGQLDGRECDALCQYEERWDGKGQREAWSILRPKEARQAKPVEKKQVRSLNTRFAKVFKKLAPGAAPAPGPQPAPAAEANGTPPPSPSDIPF